jgi:flagellar secretion chaperone FliS
MVGYGQNQYLKAQVTTVDNVKLVVLLYEGAIGFLLKAQEGLKERNVVQKHNHIQKALKIIEELKNSLNFSKGGEIAQSLNALYIFMDKHLTEANMKNDSQKIQEVINILTSLKEAWALVASKPEALKAANQKPQPSGIRI